VLTRVLDLFLLALLSFLIIFILLIVIPLKLFFDGFPIFYISFRVGKNKRLIKVYKFRTMINNQDFIRKEVSKYTFKGYESIPLDSTIYTNMGRFFEKFQIVEFPQLINILKGEMSFVGYRPLPSDYVKKQEKDFVEQIFTTKYSRIPGLTGFTQLIGKENLESEKRLEIESLETDFYQNSPNLKILICYFLMIYGTITLVVTGKTSNTVLKYIHKIIKLQKVK